MKRLIFFSIAQLGILTHVYAQESLVPYLFKQGFKQGGMLLSAKPVKEVLNDPSGDPETRKYLELSERLLDFASSELGQSTGRSYQKFIRLGRPWVTQIVMAAPKNSIDPYLFKYPIVGDLPYRGFFDEEDAVALQKSLESRGLDTYRRNVEAFSTTGWLPDPLLSTMFEKTSRFIELIFHELTHSTFYFESEADFNEAFASWMGFKGAIAFVEKHPHSVENPSQILDELNKDHQRQIRFAKIFGEILLHARAHYEKNPRGETREMLFDWIKERFKKEGDFSRYAEFPWNNASLSAFGTYYEMVEPIDAYAIKNKLSPKELLHQVKATGPSIIREFKKL
jgi:predicted aminopeptidase